MTTCERMCYSYRHKSGPQCYHAGPWQRVAVQCTDDFAQSFGKQRHTYGHQGERYEQGSHGLVFAMTVFVASVGFATAQRHRYEHD